MTSQRSSVCRILIIKEFAAALGVFTKRISDEILNLSAHIAVRLVKTPGTAAV